MYSDLQLCFREAKANSAKNILQLKIKLNVDCLSVCEYVKNFFFFLIVRHALMFNFFFFIFMFFVNAGISSVMVLV